MKTYIKPIVNIVEIQQTYLLCSSFNYNNDCRCDEDCKIWHICQDRQYGKFCEDKKSKY